MKRVFDRAVVGHEAARMLAELRQENRTVSDYSIEFRTLAAECRWNEEAQWEMFLRGLAATTAMHCCISEQKVTLWITVWHHTFRFP